MSDLIARRRQIVGMLTAEKNRLKRAMGRVRGDIEEHIEWLEGRKDGLDEEIDQLVRSTWRPKDDLRAAFPVGARYVEVSAGGFPSWAV